MEISPLPGTGIRAAVIVDLLQVLAELIDNATRFSPPDIPVRITVGPLADGGVRAEVRDQGCGPGERAAAELDARLSGPGRTGSATSRRWGCTWRAPWRRGPASRCTCCRSSRAAWRLGSYRRGCSAPSRRNRIPAGLIQHGPNRT